MFALRRSWLSRSPRPSPLRGVELLEERRAPAAGFLASLPLAADPGPAALSLGALILHHRTEEMFPTAFLPPFRAASKLEERREDGGRDRRESDNHPFLMALLSAAGGMALDTGLPWSALANRMGDPTSIVVSPATVPLGTAPMSPAIKPANSAPGVSVSLSNLATPGVLANLPKLPLAEGLGFPSFNPAARKPADVDRPARFALSPFDPSGLDIVPVPLPRGLDEKLADLFGDPPPEPLHSASAAREVAPQLLPVDEAFPRISFPVPPLAATEMDRAEEMPAPNAATDAFFSAGTALDPLPDVEEEGPPLESVTRAVMVLLASGAGISGMPTSPERQRRGSSIPVAGEQIASGDVSLFP